MAVPRIASWKNLTLREENASRDENKLLPGLGEEATACDIMHIIGDRTEQQKAATLGINVVLETRPKMMETQTGTGVGIEGP
jgi:hypothetical protein